MAHTVMCVATVYFTAIVGCAFSSPKRTPESQETRIDVDVEETRDHVTDKIVTENRTDSKSEPTFQNKNDSDLDHGGGNITNFNIDSGEQVTNDTIQDGNSENQERTKQKGDTKQSFKDTVKAIEKMHIDNIKNQLLEKLRMEKPPVYNHSMPILPLRELRGYLRDQVHGKRPKSRQQFFAKTVQVYVMGTDETNRCSLKKSAGCYQFDVNDKVSANDVYSAELWIYKLFNHNDPYLQSFIVSELGRGIWSFKLQPRNIIKRVDTRLKHGWLKVKITDTVVRWLQKPKRNHGISILCKGCQRKNHKTIFSSKHGSMPFIVINTRKGYRRRSARSLPVQCTDTTRECCLAPLQIDFHEIGWTGIVAPRKIHASYCRGSCHDRTDFNSNHSQIVQEYRWSVASGKQMKEMTPCCSPISFASQSLLYVDTAGVVRSVVVPNIRATACGCL